MAESRGQFLPQQTKLPRLIFVTGGPGTGKGTQCANLVERNGFKHVSIGDLVRAEIKSGSEIGHSIKSIAERGDLVPKELIIDLLMQALKRIKAHTLLIDGFPRDTQQAVYLEQLGVPVDYILHYEADSDQVLLDRLLERGRTSGRADDREETIIYRFQVYKSESMPVLSLYDPFNILHRVNCMGSIQEIYLRTLRTLRPEVLTVMGPLSAGKTTVARKICAKYDWEYLDFKEVRAGSSNEEEVVQTLIWKLGTYRQPYRVLVDGFPENLQQARLFASISGDPDYVIYLHCPKDTCQERILRLGKSSPSYLSSAEISKRYQDFAAEAKGIKAHYIKHLGTAFKELDGGVENKFLVQSQAFEFVEPEVVVVRGKVVRGFLEYLREKLGFRLVNAQNVLRLWREGRALSSTPDLPCSSDDPELLPLLKRLLYSGTKGRKFALYNFALSDFSLLSNFDLEVATIKQAYFLYTNTQPVAQTGLTTGYFNLPPDQELTTEHLFCSHKATAIPINGLNPAAELTETDKAYYDKVLYEQSEARSGRLIWVYGAKLSGKTTTAKLLVALAGCQLLDYAAVVEETKAALSTEEEPKEALNFTEFCEGLRKFLGKRPGVTFVADGLPEIDTLMVPGGKGFKDLELPEGGEGELAMEEDPSVTLKMTGVAERWSQLFLSYLSAASDSVLFLSVPNETLVKRGRKAAELTDEDETPAELIAEIGESELWMYYFAQKRYFPGLLEEFHRMTVPCSTVAETKAILELAFTRRVIIFRSFMHFKTAEAIRRLCYQYRMCYLNFFAVCDEIMKGGSALGLRLKLAKAAGTQLPFELKIEVLTAYVEQHVPVRCRFIVLTQYEFPSDTDFPSCFDELAALEKVMGKMHALVSVVYPERAENGVMENLPVRIRKKVRQPGDEEEEEEKKVDVGDEEAPGEAVPVALQAEEPEVVPMWNNYQPSNLALAFQNYKGLPAQWVQVHAQADTILSDLEARLQDIVQHLSTRWSVQYIISPDLDKPLEAALQAKKATYVPSSEYYEPLPLDISELGTYTKRLNSLLTNPRAKDFHKRYIKQMTVPFATFFAAFATVLEASQVKSSPGLRKAIGAVIDGSRNGCVSVNELNSFFDLWENEAERAKLLRDGQMRDQEGSKSDPLGYQLVLIVAQSDPDPVTGASSFATGTRFDINHEGCASSSRFCGDSITLFGRDNPVVKNDVVFSSADTRVKNSHFSILSLGSGYHVTDAGTVEGVKVRLEDVPIVLRGNVILGFGSRDKCVVRTCSVQSHSRPSDHFLERLEYSGPSSDTGITSSSHPTLELEFLSGFHYGRRIVLRVEEKPRFFIGNGSDCDVYLPDSPSPLQAWIDYSDSGWTLLDLHTKAQTWVYVNSYDRVQAGRPSQPLKLRHGMSLSVPGTTFKALFTQKNAGEISLPTLTEVRQLRFRDIYVINRRLGKGVYEQVFECTHKGSKERYAVKIYPKRKLLPEALSTLAALRKYDHPSVCRVEDIVEEDKAVFVIAELAEGEDVLTPLLGSTGITEDAVAALARQMFAAVAYLHSIGVTHTDLKPDCFRHCADSDTSFLKLIDFAASRVVIPAERLSERVGSMHYTPPEVMKGKSDFKSDVWSLGALLYVLFCGQPPFAGRTEAEVQEKVKAGKPTFKEVGWKKVSRTARRLIASMLAATILPRPTAAEVLNHPWTQHRSKSVNYTKPLAEKAFKNLKMYSTSSKMQQALLQHITNTQLTKEERAAIADLFAQMDKDSSGFLTGAELKAGLSSGGLEMSDSEVDALLDRLDSNHTGVINYSEFVTGVAERTNLLAKERLSALFASLDTDGSGDITAAELKSAMGGSEESWLPLLAQVDSNKDGKVDAREFKEMLLSFSN